MAIPVTLEALLASRDARSALQRVLAEAHPELTLLTLTVVAPGRVKQNRGSGIVGRAAEKAVGEAFGANLKGMTRRDLHTGYEAYFLIAGEAGAVKRRAMEIEDTHPLGRLMDLDVAGPGLRPLSRAEFGGEERRCLICGERARVCMRRRSHTPAEIEARVASLTEGYLNQD